MFLLGGEGGATGIVARQPHLIDDFLELGKMAELESKRGSCIRVKTFMFRSVQARLSQKPICLDSPSAAWVAAMS